MSDQKLELILQAIKQVQVQVGGLSTDVGVLGERIDSLDQRMDKFETRMDKFEEDLTEIKVLVSDIPFIKQAALETQEHVKRLDERQLCFEKETKSTLNNHFISIDILNQRQLQLEATVQAL